MSAAAAACGEAGTQAAFGASQDRFDVVVGWLEGAEAAGLAHGELEARLQVDARELFRVLYQDHLDLRALHEQRMADVVAADGTVRGTVESGHRRGLATVFGPVSVSRVAYRRRGRPNLHPADATLNLPVERHSHGLRRLAALEGARGSYDGAVEAIERVCGQRLGKRQVEGLARAAAVDFDDFYTSRLRPVGEPDDILVISCDGKGVVMRPDALRPATRKAAEDTTTKLATRLSRGEKRNRKRMAEVGAVYDAAPAVRTADDIMAPDAPQDRPRAPAPVAKGKWLTASVVDDAATVVAQIFDEADRRDPAHQRTWVALVDGNNHQCDTRSHNTSEHTGSEVDVMSKV